ncbi:MAG: type VI secretion system lipoprotein TssJ [Ignavibacteriales bacterium]|nr:MAG: type VI secretion system lipoprotein TssJ [Ignavibacteriales bacterium]
MKFILSLLFIVSFIFSSCGGVQTISLDMICDDDCNGNNAIVVKIYQLKNADKFRNASFESLISNTEVVLGDDLIPNSKYEKTLIPDESFEIPEYEIKPEAAYLGIVGDFYSPAKDSWQQVVPASDVSSIKITVHENSISVVKD